MAPPELAADAPVLDVAHPLEVGLRPVAGHEADAAVFDGADRRLGERRGAHVPLVGEPGLQYRPRSVAARHRQRVRLDLLEQAERLEVGDHARARLEAVETAVGLRRGVGDACIGRQHVDQRQAVALADLVVVEVVGRRDLHAAAAEGRIDVIVGDDRDLAPGQRQAQGLAHEVPVALVLGVHRDRDVAEHGLRSRRRDDQVARAVGERIAQVPQRPGLGLGDDFEVGQRGVQHRIPVHEALAAIDQAFLDAGARRLRPLRPTAARPS